MSFSERLKRLRKEKDLTQRQLADNLNLSAGAIGMYESGNRIPDNEILIRIADFFNVSTDFLLSRTNVRRPEDWMPETIAAMRAPGLEGYDDLPEEAKKILQDLIKDVYIRFGKHNQNKGEE